MLYTKNLLLFWDQSGEGAREHQMNEQISQRIARALGSTDLTELLAESLSGSDLHSLLLAVSKRRVSKIEPSKLAQRSAVSSACDLDARILNQVDCIAYETAANFEAIELSPVNPLGAVAALAGLDQGNVLTTIRAFECASDPTTGLVLECARRRKSPKDRQDTVRLCASQRVVRFPLPDNPAFRAHFKLFSLVTAGRDTGSFGFETAALREHIGFYLSLLLRLTATGFAFEDIVVELSDTRAVAHLCSHFQIDRDEIRALVRARDSSSSSNLLRKYTTLWPETVTQPGKELAQYGLPEHLLIQLGLLEQNICGPLSAEHTNVRFTFNMHRLTGLGYYEGPCFHIKMKNAAGQAFMLADGGFVTWTQRLLCDTKERAMTSAIGVELMCRMFRRSR